MRVLLDANLFISLLLTGGGRNTPTVIIQAVADRARTLLLADEILREVRGKVATKPYRRDRIQPSDIDRLWSTLVPTAEVLPPRVGPLPERGRDRKVDLLLALAERGHADYLVTGDKGLLVLAIEVLPLRIVSPGAFVREAGLV